MVMLFQMMKPLLAFLAMANASKLIKTVPTISNSLVNLGKMEIAFYFNGKPTGGFPKPEHISHSELFAPPSAEQGCPCSNFKSGPSLLSDPSEIINSILKSNDFFKDPTSSFCCGSHERVQESTVLFELEPNNQHFNPIQGLSVNQPHQANPNILRSPIPFPPFLFNKARPKSKALEIVLFPKRKDLANFELSGFFGPKKRESTLKPELLNRNKDSISKQPSASVKKDLTTMEKKMKQEVITTEEPADDLQTDAPPVTSGSNAL